MGRKWPIEPTKFSWGGGANKDQKDATRVISNVSHNSFCGSYLEISSRGLIHGGPQRSGRNMGGLPIQ